jgi:WD40 repeat protein
VAPDGSWLASAGYDGAVRIWNPATGAIRHTLTDHTSGVDVLAVAPDGSWLAASGNGFGEGGQVWIWDPATDTADPTAIGRTGGVRALAVAPDGCWLSSAGYDGAVRIWNPATGAIRHTLIDHTSGVDVLAVAPDGSWLAAAENPTFGSGHTFGDKNIFNIFRSEGGKVWIWDLVTGATRHVFTGHTRNVSALAVAPDGSWLASAGGSIFSGRHTFDPGHIFGAVRYHGGEVRIWDPITGTIRHILSGHTEEVSALAVAPEGSWLASADHDGEVRIWDAATGAILHILTGHTKAVWALVVAPDGSWLASAGHDGQVRIWDPVTGIARHILTGHTGKVSALVVAPDGSWLASAGHDGEKRIWGPSTGTPLTSLRVAGYLSHLLVAAMTIVTAGNTVPTSSHSSAGPIKIRADL